ncbi:hypothetical protein CES85_3421 (plasmid) [Ochrobactrum quorumnocens]|uniref:Uncharacterized protein n=1 Tax=Ochrobactrum quorumnocens TaxID=271865 RepID=A0A248UM76_9HYPH|nr:hypothetical protein CES85_3421 [[Ochrobactrum] quorumnocens]
MVDARAVLKVRFVTSRQIGDLPCGARHQPTAKVLVPSQAIF